MKKKALSLILALIMAISLLPTFTLAAEAEEVLMTGEDGSVPSGAAWQGEGTENSPYLLKTADDLTLLSAKSSEDTFIGVCFKFDADISLPEGWTPVGTTSSRFAGSIDGDGHLLTVPACEKALIGSPKGATLKNLNIFGTQINSNGVVALYTTGASGTAITIENVTLKSGTQTLGSGFVGGYASGSYPAVIRNCTVEEGVTIGYDGTQSNIGSFGGDFNGTIVGCVSHATVKGVNYVGGISGSKGQTMGDYIIADCIFDGEIIATGDNAGGISGGGYAGTNFGLESGPNTPCATIINCHASGSISGAGNVGGILGAEPGVKECWNNGIGYIQNNLFTGTLSATGENVGGIVGYMSCINSMNVISGNFYLDSCGADKGIGAAGMVETPETTGGGGTGWNKYTLSGKKFGRTDDPMGAGADALAKGCTAAELADGTVLAALNSGTSSSENWISGSACPTLTAYGAKHLIRMSCAALSSSGGVSQEANGADFLSGKELTLHYSDGTTSTVSATDSAVTKQYTVSGDMIGTYFPASVLYDGHQLVFNLAVTNTRPVLKAGVADTAAASVELGKAYRLDLGAVFADPDGDELSYSVKIGSAKKYVSAETSDGIYSYTPSEAGSVTLKFMANDGTTNSTQTYTVTLGISAPPEPAPANNITVSFTLLGDSSHGESGAAHTLKAGNLTTWIATTSVTVPEGSKVINVISTVLSQSGCSWMNGGVLNGEAGNYIQSITSPSGVTLAEFTNGKSSGWMYTLNGSHPLLGINEQSVSNGDVIVFHYTDNYTIEQGSESWTPSAPSSSQETSVITPAATVSGSTATVMLTDSAIKGAVEAAVTNTAGGRELVIAPKGTGSAANIEVVIPAASAKTVSENAGLTVKVQTESAGVSIPGEALSEIAQSAGGESIKVSLAQKTAADLADTAIDTKDAVIVEVKISSGDRAVTSFGGKALTITVPVGAGYTAGESYRVIVLSSDGKKEVMAGKCVTRDGKTYVEVETLHLSTYIVKSEKALSFADVASDAWYNAAVIYAAENGLMGGTGDGEFTPDGGMTRAMLVTVLYRMAGSPEVSGKCGFTDVLADTWYTSAVIWATENGVVNGMGDGSFAPQGTVSRQQAAAILYRFSGSPAADADLFGFADAKGIADWALPAMQWASAKGIITGSGSGLEPLSSATRAQSAALLMRYRAVA